MQGIIKTYSFDRGYFKVGCAFRLHNKSEVNYYFNAILDTVNDEQLIFITRHDNHHPSGVVIINLDELTICSLWDIIKLTPDYKDGEFNSEE